jgi:hypothetical protein
MSLIETVQKPSNKSDTLLKAIFKILTALITVSAALIVALFFLVLCILLASVAVSNPARQIVEPASISEILEAAWQLIGLTCYLSAFGVPVILCCVGSLGFPLGLIGWRFDLISKRVCAIVGFLLGVIPFGLIQLNSYFSSSLLRYSNGMNGWMDGARILAQGVVVLITIFIAGAFGAMGGYIFWIIWNFLAPKNHLDNIN